MIGNMAVRTSKALPCTLGVLGFLLILLGTSRYGTGLSPDSATMVAAARSLTAGRGYLNYAGNPLVESPPLFPTFLALGMLVTPDALTVARYSNALAFGATAFLSSRWLVTYAGSPRAALAGSLAVLLSLPLIRVSVFAWTEPLFALFTLVFLVQMDRFRRTGQDIAVVLAAVATALAVLTRYMGFTLVLTGLVLLLLERHASPGRRTRHAVTFFVIAALPVLLWLLRNELRFSTLTGPRFSTPQTLGTISYAMEDTVTTWLLPARLPLLQRVALILAAIVAVAGRTIVSLRQRGASGVAICTPQIAPLLLFIAVYVIALCVILANIAADPVDNRFMSPMYVPVILALTVSVAALLNAWSRSTVGAAVRVMGVTCVSLWLIYLFGQVYRTMETYLEDGAGGYHVTRWMTSEILEDLRRDPLDGIIFNNAPHILYFATGQVARRSPRKYGVASKLPANDLVTLEQSLRGGRPVYLVWFDGGAGGEHSYSVEELSAEFTLSQIVKRSDGAIYLVDGR